MSGWYFAYGSNMNPHRVTARGLQIKGIKSGQLRGYQLVFNKRSVKHPGAASANVLKKPGGRVEGVLYELDAGDEILQMDPYEGYPIRYTRSLLPVVMEDRVLSAWVYLANEDHIAWDLRPASWYLQHLLAGEPYLSRRYHNWLKQTLCLPDSHEEPV